MRLGYCEHNFEYDGLNGVAPKAAMSVSPGVHGERNNLPHSTKTQFDSVVAREYRCHTKESSQCGERMDTGRYGNDVLGSAITGGKGVRSMRWRWSRRN